MSKNKKRLFQVEVEIFETTFHNFNLYLFPGLKNQIHVLKLLKYIYYKLYIALNSFQCL